MDELIRIFPHEKIRPIQRELAIDAYRAMNNGRYLLAHAPTGIGKTAAVITAAIRIAKKKGYTIFFSTPRTTQQEIVIRTTRLMKKKGVDISIAGIVSKKSLCMQKGIEALSGRDFYEYCEALVKNNECSYLENARKMNGERGIWSHEDIYKHAEKNNICGYEYALRIARDSDIIILDYNYLFAPFIRKPLFLRINKKLEESILIIDEAHNLIDRIKEFHSHKLSSRTLRLALREAKELENKELEEDIIMLSSMLTDYEKLLLEKKKKEAYITREFFIDTINTYKDYEKMIEELWINAEHIRIRKKISFLGRVADFLDEWREGEEGYIRIVKISEEGKNRHVSIEKHCIDASLFSKEVFTTARGGVLMSGTLKPIIMYKELLGIENADIKEYKSPYPEENKKWIIYDGVTTKYSERREEEYEKIARAISMISSIDQNIAVFFPSYEFMENIAKRLKTDKQVFLESPQASKKEKQGLIEEFKKASFKERKGLLLGVTGGSYSEGIDLPGSSLGIVIIVGVPLSIPDLETRATIRYYDHKFGKGWLYAYQLPALRKTLQAAGRVVRSEKDRGVVVLMDSRYKEKEYIDLLPRVEILSNIEEINERIKEFFKD